MLSLGSAFGSNSATDICRREKRDSGTFDFSG